VEKTKRILKLLQGGNSKVLVVPCQLCLKFGANTNKKGRLQKGNLGWKEDVKASKKKTESNMKHTKITKKQMGRNRSQNVWLSCKKLAERNGKTNINHL